MIEFEQQRIALTILLDHMRGKAAKICQDSKGHFSMAKNKLAGFTRIMRHRHGLDSDIADGESIMRRNLPPVCELARARFLRDPRAAGRKDRDLIFAGERDYTPHVIIVFVGDENTA